MKNLRDHEKDPKPSECADPHKVQTIKICVFNVLKLEMI